MKDENNPLFEEVLKKAEHELTLPYYDSKPKNIYALIQFGNNPVLRPRIISFINSSFNILRKNAYDQKIKEDKLFNDGYKTSVMINHIIFGALGRTAGLLNEKSLAPLIFEELIGLKKVFHGLTLERGTLSIALSILNYKGDINFIKEQIDKAVSNEYSIQQNKDILEMFYAFCIIKQDKIRALEYLANLKYTENLSLVAATLADLNAKEAIPILKERISKLNNPVEEEAFLEAITRLEIQVEAQNPLDRMIIMFGKRNSTEMALGNDSDNIFTLRAIEKTGDEELGVYFE